MSSFEGLRNSATRTNVVRLQLTPLCNLILCIAGFVCAVPTSVRAGVGTFSAADSDDSDLRTVFQVGQLYSGSEAPIRDAVIVVQQGKIIAIGPRSSVKWESSDKVVDCRNATAIPGLLMADTNLVERGNDEPRTFTPENRAIDAFDFFKDRAELLAAGITSVHLSAPSNRLMPGKSAIVKLAGKETADRILLAEESMKIVLSRESLNPPTIYEPPVGAVSVDRPLKPTQPQLGASLAEVMAGLRAIFEGTNSGKSEDLSIETLRNWLDAKRTFQIHASSGSELRAALGVSKWLSGEWYVVAPKEFIQPFDKELLASNAFRGVVLKSEVRPGAITNPPVPARGGSQCFGTVGICGANEGAGSCS